MVPLPASQNIYAPTNDSEPEEKAEFYDTLEGSTDKFSTIERPGCHCQFKNLAQISTVVTQEENR